MSLLSSRRDFHSNMPKGTLSLCIIQIVSTLSYSVLYSTLVLYMKGKLGLEVSSANSVMGVFIAFNYALHLLGGFWGGRLLSNRSLFCVGMVAQVIGCVLLSFSSTTFLYYGLAAFLTGSGLNATCLNCMLTQRFAPEDTGREKAFLWNYAAMNVGFFVGFSLSGVFQMTQNYQVLFLLSSLGNVLALFLCGFSWNQLADTNTPLSKKDLFSKKKARILGLAGIALLPFLLSQMFQYAAWANKLVLVTGFVMLLLVVYLAKQQGTKEAKDRLHALAIFMLVGTIFWTLSLIGPMGLTVFIEYNVDREYLNWIIPPQWFQNINTLAIVILGPILGSLFHKLRKKGVQINIPSQFALALFFIGMAFVILPIGIAYAGFEGKVNPNWIVASYLLQGIGEILISPIGYAMIGALAPPSLQGVMMGILMLNTGVGATLSSYSSNLMVRGQESTTALVTNSGYSQVFLGLGLFALAASMVVFFFIPKLRKLIHEQYVRDSQIPMAVTERVSVCE
ncbi:MAG: peptide MFS transporter [Legionellales bacterium]